MACLSLIASLGLAAPQPDAPSGPPPDQAHVVMQDVNDGRLVMRITLWKPVFETRTREVLGPNGQRTTEAYAVKQLVAEQREQAFVSSDYRVYTVAGQALSAGEAAERFAKETAVLVSRCGKMLDPAYTPLYEPGALILYVRPSRGGHGYGASTAPPPSAPPTTAPSPLPPPLGPPPRPATVTVNGEDVSIVEFDWRPVFEQKQVMKTIAGERPDQARTVCEIVPVAHWVPTARQSECKLADCKLLDRQGEALEPGKLSVGKPQTILVHDQNVKFDPAHLQLMRPETVVLAIPPQPQPAANHAFGGPAQWPVAQARAKVQGNDLTITRMVFEMVMQKVQVTVMKDGKPVIELREEVVTHSKPIHESLSLDKVQAHTVKGDKIERAVLAKLLAAERPVIVTLPNQELSKQDLALVKPEAIVIVHPGHGHAAGGHRVIPMAPPPPRAPGSPPPEA